MPAGVIKTVNLDPYGAGHFLSEGFDHNRSAEQILLKANAGALVTGQVVGKVTATGQFAILNPAGGDGTEAAAGILWQGRDNVAATQRAVIVARGATVNGNLITWPAGITNNQKTTAIAQLAALGIIVRL